MKSETTVERGSERELVVTRMFDGPARIIFDAWTNPELLKEALDGAVGSGMERGMRDTFDQLETLIASLHG
jgi:hypothetical protein